MTDLDTTPTDLAGLANDIDVTRKELGRADGKAGHLLTLAVGGTALLLGLHAGQHMPVVCRWAALTAGVLAVVTLRAVLWPRTGGRRSGYLAHGNRTPTQIVAVQSPQAAALDMARLARDLSRLAAAKFRLIQVAMLLLAAAMLFTVAGVALS